MLYCVENHAVAYKSSGLKIFHAKLRSIFFTWISIRLLLFSCATYRICYRYKLSSAIVKAVLHPFHVLSYIAKSRQKLINQNQMANFQIDSQTSLLCMATLGTEESGCCGEVAIIGTQGCHMKILFRKYNMFIVPPSW